MAEFDITFGLIISKFIYYYFTWSNEFQQDVVEHHIIIINQGGIPDHDHHDIKINIKIDHHIIENIHNLENANDVEIHDIKLENVEQAGTK